MLALVIAPLDRWDTSHYSRGMERTAEILIAEVEAFLDRHEMSPTAFGLASVNDGHFVRDLREGKDIKLSTVDRVIKFMAGRNKIQPAAFCHMRLSRGQRSARASK